MIEALPLTFIDTREAFLKLTRWLLRWGQIPIPILLGLILGALMVSTARELVVSLTAIAIYFITIIVNPLGGLLLWATTYAFTESSVNISLGAFIPDLSPTRFCVSFLTAMLLAQAATGRRGFPRLRGVEVAALLFVVGMGLSAPAAAEPIAAMQMIFDTHLIPVLAYFLTRNLILERRDLEKLLSAFVIIGAYTAAFAIYEQLTGNILFVKIQPWMMGKQYSEHIRVLSGLYGDDNAFGLIMGMTLPIAFHRFIKTPTLGKKMLYATLIVLMLGGEFCTFKRAGWLGLIVALVIIQFFYPKFRRIFLVLVFLFTAVFFVAGDLIAESEVGARATTDLETANGRTERWALAIELWKEKPILGHGYKRFDDLAGIRAVESYYLHILVSAGLVAFLPFLAFILLIVKDSIAIFRRSPRDARLFVDREVIVIFWGMLAVYLVVSFSNYMAVSINHILPYILMGAMVGSQGALLERKRQANQ